MLKTRTERNAGFCAFGRRVLAAAATGGSFSVTTTAGFIQPPLLSDDAIPVFPATLKEAMTYHALTKQKKEDRQHNYKYEVSNSE
jgi:hypothetical protein